MENRNCPISRGLKHMHPYRRQELCRIRRIKNNWAIGINNGETCGFNGFYYGAYTLSFTMAMNSSNRYRES